MDQYQRLLYFQLPLHFIFIFSLQLQWIPGLHSLLQLWYEGYLCPQRRGLYHHNLSHRSHLRRLYPTKPTPHPYWRESFTFLSPIVDQWGCCRFFADHSNGRPTAQTLPDSNLNANISLLIELLPHFYFHFDSIAVVLYFLLATEMALVKVATNPTNQTWSHTFWGYLWTGRSGL